MAASRPDSKAHRQHLIVTMDSINHLSALDVVLTMTAGDDHRTLTLTEGQSVELGRVSRSENKNLQANPNNALFDCPVISRSHAKLIYQRSIEPEKQVSIKDLNSKHGTAVNGDRLQPHVERRLQSGDRIKIGGPIVVGNGKQHITPTMIDELVLTGRCVETESHDGVTFVLNIPSSQSGHIDNENLPPNQRGFHAPCYDSENDDDDDDHISSCSEYDQRDSNGDCYNSEDEETSAQTTPEQAKASKQANINRSIELGELCTLNQGEESTCLTSIYVPDTINPSISTAVRTFGADSTVSDPRSSTLWPIDFPRDYSAGNGSYKPCPPFMVSSYDDDEEDDDYEEEEFDEDDDSCDEESDQRNARDERTTMENCVPGQTDFKIPVYSSFHSLVENVKPRYDPVRSSPAAAVAEVSDFPRTSTINAEPVEAGLAKNIFWTTTELVPTFTSTAAPNAKAPVQSYPSFSRDFVPRTAIAPNLLNGQGYEPLPAVDDIVQGLAWMDRPQQSATLNKISIPELVEHTIDVQGRDAHETTSSKPEVREPLPSASKQGKRKADVLEDVKESDNLPLTPAKKPRAQAQNQSGLMKGMLFGALGGAIGTMAFLASPATDIFLDWLDA